LVDCFARRSRARNNDGKLLALPLERDEEKCARFSARIPL
jgi:hypothetical protein